MQKFKVGCLGLVLTSLLTSTAYSQEVPFLGKGYISSTETQLYPCLVVNSENIRYTGKQTSSFDFIKNTDLDQLLMKLGLSFSGKMNLEMMTISGSTAFAVDMAEDNYSDSVVISYKVRGKNATFDGAAISDSAKVALNSATEDRERKIREKCGDKFVSSVELGADLNIGFKVTYVNKEFKSKFQAEMQADILSMISGSGSTAAIVNKYSNKASIKIAAFQRGGDTSRLANIFEADANQNYHIYKCGLNSLKTEETPNSSGTHSRPSARENEGELVKLANESCIAALDGMLVYMRSDFPNQIANMKYDVFLNRGEAEQAPGQVETRTYQGAAIIGAQFTNYKEGGYPHLFSGVNQGVSRELQEKRNKILNSFKKISYYLSRVDSFMSLSHLDESDKIELKSKKLLAEDALSKTREAGVYCYKFNPDLDDNDNNQIKKMCDESYAAFNKIYNDVRIFVLNPDSLQINQNFYHFCRLRKEPNQEIECRTVKKVALFLEGIPEGQEKDFCAESTDAEVDDVNLCSNMLVQLQGVTDLDLSTKATDGTEKIFDLSPIRNLVNLKKINLSGNTISDLGPISFANNNMEEINLKGNNLDNLSVLEKFKKLKFVNLSNNRLESFKCGIEDFGCSKWRSKVEVNLSGNNNILEIGTSSDADALQFLSINNEFKKLTFGKITCELDLKNNNKCLIK